MGRAVTFAIGAALCAAGLSGCTSSGATSPPPGTGSSHAQAVSAMTRSSHARSTPGPKRPSSSSHSASTAPGNPGARAATRAQQVLDSMTEAQRIGQLFMVDCPSSGVRPATTTALQQYFVGSVILDGNSTLGVTRTHSVALALQRERRPSNVGLFIATDQEGGLVQRMRGPGFSSIPSAVEQGTERPWTTLRSNAKVWGQQLRAAGITVDLAPVLDTVPPGDTDNPPIGDLDREYGHTPATVTSHGVAFADGLALGGVDATAKHFPGLGRVTANTDTSSGVTDRITTSNDAYLAPYAAAVRHNIAFIMMSTAIYSRIDPGRPAAFSYPIVTGMLRHNLGFRGVIITDDVGAAAQVRGYTPRQRALDVINAGGTMILTVDPSVIPAMTSALSYHAAVNPAFRQRVDAAALTVLTAKEARGLLS